MLDLDKLRVTASAPTASGVSANVGVALPGIGDDRWAVSFVVVHHVDRFNPGVKTRQYPLAFAGGNDGLWSADVSIAPESGTSFGLSGRYLYPFQLSTTADSSGQAGDVVVPWFTDPCALATDDVGQLSAFDTPDSVSAFSWRDDSWKVPDLADLVVYELHTEEFNTTFAGVTARLDYLKSLGVNCLELMPVTSLKIDFDWGYGPLHYFAPNERWGGGDGFKRLLDSCHRAGVAVIVDVVFQHVDPSFPYAQVYSATQVASPMIDGTGDFGPKVNYDLQFSRDYVHEVTAHWLSEYHVDGFRYDEVTDLYNEPSGDPYAGFAYDVYNESLEMSRFTPSGGASVGEYSRVIQVPEALNRPAEVLGNTYSSATWQDALLYKVEDMARWGYVDEQFVHLLDADSSGYPHTKTVHDVKGNPVDMPVAPFQYLNTHDHSQLVTFLTANQRAADRPTADRTAWYKIQPFVVALYTSQGVPMLWQGQEFSDNWVLPNSGDSRVQFDRAAHWEYFYDAYGAPMVRLHRILGALRSRYPSLRSRESFFFNVQSNTANGVVAYSRSAPEQVAVVVLNFSDSTQFISAPAPIAGTYRELVDADSRQSPLHCVAPSAGDPLDISVPSNYGYVFVSPE